jgi:hypothetical protein
MGRQSLRCYRIKSTSPPETKEARPNSPTHEHDFWPSFASVIGQTPVTSSPDGRSRPMKFRRSEELQSDIPLPDGQKIGGILVYTPPTSEPGNLKG